MSNDLDDIFGSSTCETQPIETVECPGPGVYYGVPAEAYHAWPAISSTFIKAFAVNPYKAKFHPFKGSAAATLGSACHSYTLEGETAFRKEFHVLADIPCPADQNPKGWKNTSRYKDLLSMAEAESNGRQILTAAQWDSVRAIDKSLREHPTSNVMLNRGCNEMSLVWKDETTGLMCKARLDDYFEGVPSDLKTCADVEWFHREIYNRKYNLQGGWYSNGVEACGLDLAYFCFIAAQTTETYPVRCGYIRPDKLQEAQLEVIRWLSLVKECQDVNVWPNLTIPVECNSIKDLTAAALLEEW